MINTLLPYFDAYPATHAPFMHQQLAEWTQQRPLEGLTVLHHVPVVVNTLLKIACLVAAGANVTVTNPSFLTAQPEAISALMNADIPYVDDVQKLKGIAFDLYFDCGAELYQHLGKPQLGAIELTATGDQFYRQVELDFPVISIDPTFTKQLETLFGSAESTSLAIKRLTGMDVFQKTWLLFGFGKIGRGVAYACAKNATRILVADINPDARAAAHRLGLETIDPVDQGSLKKALAVTDIVVTATGKQAILNPFPKIWFENKTLVNMGILDEYGEQFHAHEVLNQKAPINFILEDPTPIQYIDPEFYAHNIAAIELLQQRLPAGVSNLSKEMDTNIIEYWCRFHQQPVEKIRKWLVVN